MQKKEIIGDLLNQLRLIRQRAAFEGMPSGIERGKINAILVQLLLLSEHLDSIIGATLLSFTHCRPSPIRCFIAPQDNSHVLDPEPCCQWF